MTDFLMEKTWSFSLRISVCLWKLSAVTTELLTVVEITLIFELLQISLQAIGTPCSCWYNISLLYVQLRDKIRGDDIQFPVFQKFNVFQYHEGNWQPLIPEHVFQRFCCCTPTVDRFMFQFYIVTEVDFFIDIIKVFTKVCKFIDTSQYINIFCQQ